MSAALSNRRNARDPRCTSRPAFRIDQKLAHIAVQKVLDTVLETIATEGRVELRNFGIFEVKRRAARQARNPRTGERVDVAEKDVVTFCPGKEMQRRIESNRGRVG